jgi:hypothetical protein
VTTATLKSTRVWARLPPEIYDYLFRQVLAGERRAKQDLTAEFYRKLYDECQRRGIPATWSLENAELIEGVMSKLNFNGR